MKKKLSFISFISLVLTGLLLTACSNFPCNCSDHSGGTCPMSHSQKQK